MCKVTLFLSPFFHLLFRPTLERGSMVQFPRNPIWDWFEANWILELYSTLVPKPDSWFSKSEALLLALFFGLNQLIFPPQQVPFRFSINLPLFALGPLSKGIGTNFKLSANKIAWIHWSVDLRPSSKVAFIKKKFNLCYCYPQNNQRFKLCTFFYHICYANDSIIV
jgi:hypothetical protein